MKKARVFLLLLAASVLCALPAFASEVVTLPEEDGGWTLQYEGQTVFRAEPLFPAGEETGGAESIYNSDSYAVVFQPGGGRTVFLTGLSAGNVEKIQTELTRALTAGEAFQMEHIDFIDAEKVYRDPQSDVSDSQMCWAASAANALRYTGWAAAARNSGLVTEDDLMDLFVRSFEDGPGVPFYAMRWFLSGVYGGDGDSAQLTAAGKIYRGFLGEEEARALAVPYALSVDPARLSSACDDLMQKHGVALSVDFYQNNVRKGGHAMTLWGFVQQPDSSQKYTALIVADSDSDFASRLTPASRDRRDAPNKLRLLNLRRENDVWTLDYYTDAETRLTSFSSLAPAPAEEATRLSLDFTEQETVLSLPEGGLSQALAFRIQNPYRVNRTCDAELYVRVGDSTVTLQTWTGLLLPAGGYGDTLRLASAPSALLPQGGPYPVWAYITDTTETRHSVARQLGTLTVRDGGNEGVIGRGAAVLPWSYDSASRTVTAAEGQRFFGTLYLAGYDSRGAMTFLTAFRGNGGSAALPQNAAAMKLFWLDSAGAPGCPCVSRTLTAN